MDHSETESGTTLALALSVGERKLIDDTPLLTDGVVAALRQTSKKAVQLSLYQLDDMADALSAKANHIEGRMLQRRLDTLVRKIDCLTGSHLLALLETNDSADSPADLSKPTRKQPMLAVKLSPAQREILESLGLRNEIQQRLKGDGLRTIEFTHREVEYLHDQARMEVASASSLRKKLLLNVCNKIGKLLGERQLVPTPRN